MTVLIEGGGEGSKTALPVVRNIVEAYYTLKSAKTEE